MVGFLFVVFIFVVYFVVVSFRNIGNKSNEIEEVKSQSSGYGQTKQPYKKGRIKSFEIRGMQFRNDLNPEDSGRFLGYVVVEENSHDKNAVAIYNTDNKKLGYVPRGNYRLNRALREWHDGKVFAWGELTWNDFYKEWSKYHCCVNIPIGYETEKIDLLKRAFSLEFENIKSLEKDNLSSDEYFEYITNHYERLEILKSLKIKNGVNTHFPNSLVPKISKQLEKEKDWTKLIELEKYKELIDNLSPKFKETTLRRIEIAKNNLNE